MTTKKNKTQKEIEKEILMKIFKAKRDVFFHKQTSRKDIDEIREIIKKLRKLRRF